MRYEKPKLEIIMLEQGGIVLTESDVQPDLDFQGEDTDSGWGPIF